MNLEKREFKIEVAGKPLILEVSKLAEQATAAVVGTYGNTSVLVAVVMGHEDRTIDYFPLTVDYEEKFYAAGKIIGSRFIRREGRPSEGAILSGRLIDRSLRPLFDHRLRRDVQIVVTVLSYDEENDPDFVALITASAALAISEVPWGGPVAGVRVAKTTEGVMINPENSALTKEGLKPLFDAFVAGTEEKINMIELAGAEAPEDDVIKGFESAHKEIARITAFQKEIVKQIGKKKAEVMLAEPTQELREKVESFLKGKLEAAMYIKDKSARNDALRIMKTALREELANNEELKTDGVDALIEEIIDRTVHENIIEDGKRPDGRKTDELRELYAELALFKRLHGSALFMRGNTQALAVTTLGAPGAEQLVETMEVSGKRRFMLHYNFPKYSVGEVGRMGGPGRREIGHGNLAEKAIQSLIPSQDEFPYTIRVVSEILSSNGSSSMASVCSAILSLMDAGVPIKKPAAGIAMGLMSNAKGDYKILTDIQGPEDHYGDMDCKVAGTTAGITAIQMDVKIDGVTTDVLAQVFAQAKKARLEILKFMSGIIDAPREELSPFAPIILKTMINPEKIGELIGPGGKMINAIIESTGVETIDVEQDGRVFVAASDIDKARSALDWINGLMKEFQVGEVVEGPIIKILEFGAIVDLGGGKDGMIHVSELKEGFVKKVEEVVHVGDVVRAKIVKVDNGRIGLSLKAMSEN